MGDAFGHDRPPKGGRSCPGEPPPCPNSAPHSSTPSAPLDNLSHTPPPSSVSHARLPTSGSHDSMANTPFATALANRTPHPLRHAPNLNTLSSTSEIGTAGGHAKS